MLLNKEIESVLNLLKSLSFREKTYSKIVPMTSKLQRAPNEYVYHWRLPHGFFNGYFKGQVKFWKQKSKGSKKSTYETRTMVLDTLSRSNSLLYFVNDKQGSKKTTQVQCRNLDMSTIVKIEDLPENVVKLVFPENEEYILKWDKDEEYQEWVELLQEKVVDIKDNKIIREMKELMKTAEDQRILAEIQRASEDESIRSRLIIEQEIEDAELGEVPRQSEIGKPLANDDIEPECDLGFNPLGSNVTGKENFNIFRTMLSEA